MKFEIEIKPDCGYVDFYTVAHAIETKGCTFTDMVDGFDTLYWDFDFRGDTITLSYNIYEGIMLYMGDVASLTAEKQKEIQSLAEKLKELFY